jgi:hypothetical protein
VGRELQRLGAACRHLLLPAGAIGKPRPHRPDGDRAIDHRVLIHE